jgi:hypothetical protein
MWRGIALDGGGLDGGRKLRRWIVSHISRDQEVRMSWMGSVDNVQLINLPVAISATKRNELPVHR